MSNQTWYPTNPSNLANLAQKLADPTPLTISDGSPSLKPDSNGSDDRFEHKKNDFQPTWLYVHWKSSCSPPMGVFRRRFSPISRDLALSLRDPSRSHWDPTRSRRDSTWSLQATEISLRFSEISSRLGLISSRSAEISLRSG